MTSFATRLLFVLIALALLVVALVLQSLGVPGMALLAFAATIGLCAALLRFRRGPA